MNSNCMKVINNINILVLGVGGNVSQGIVKALRESNIPMTIHGACISEYSCGLYMCDEAVICPFANDDSFVDWVIGYCNQHDIDMIFTGVEENVIKLAEYEEYIKSKTKAIFISSSYSQLLVGQDKYLTCKFLKESGCNYPKYHLWTNVDEAVKFAQNVGYPLIAKPRHGKSAKGIHVLKNEQDLRHVGNLDKYVLEEFIGDDDSEYTIGCYVDKNGNLQKVFPMKRRLRKGTIVWAKTIANSAIEEECEKICRAFKPKGPFNIQLRMSKDGRPVCFELNVRFSGTTAIRSHFGFQDVKAMLYEYLLDKEIDSCFNIKEGEVYRFDEELYLQSGTTELMDNARVLSNVRKYLDVE